jgi:hypothetical protein
MLDPSADPNPFPPRGLPERKTLGEAVRRAESPAPADADGPPASPPSYRKRRRKTFLFQAWVQHKKVAAFWGATDCLSIGRAEVQRTV